MVAVIATVLVHLAVGAVVAIGWPRFEHAGGERHLTSVIILSRSTDEPGQRPSPGTHAKIRRSEPLPVASSPPPTILRAPPSMITPGAMADLPAPASGGSEDALALATQVFRRAVMARLEAQRRPLRQDRAGGGQSAGVLVFRIERSGQLVDASIVQSTGRAALDQIALETVRSAAPFPAIPFGLPDELTITLPVEFLAGGRPREGAAP
jgi:TonB family protein